MWYSSSVFVFVTQPFCSVLNGNLNAHNCVLSAAAKCNCIKDYVRSIMRKNTFVLLLALALSAGFFTPGDGYTFGLFSRYTSVKDSNGEVRIGVGDISDGKAHYYSFENEGKTIKFFVVKSPDGIIRAAFDACDVCFPAKKGYSQEGDFMVCTNCGKKFHSSRVNVVEGGCNPAPLKRETAGEQLVIKVEDILPGARFF